MKREMKLTRNNLRYTLLGQINDQVCTLRRLVCLVDASNTSQLSVPGGSIHALAISRLAVLEGCRDVDGEEVAARASSLEHGVLDGVTGGGLGGDGGSDDGGTCTCKFCGNIGESLEILGLFFSVL